MTEHNTGSPFVVAIDGPAGAGKSTVSRLLAQRLGYVLLDTGAIYRTVALVTSRQGTSWDDEAAVAAAARALDIEFRASPDGNRVFSAGEDVSEAIRTGEISQGASRVSALPAVRAALLDLQRRIGAHGRVVAEGRDVGTVVFPQAQAKFFLTADPPERARRRALELQKKGFQAPLEQVMSEMQERDRRDSSRPVAPLARAADALEIDSSGLAPEDVVTQMAAVVRQRGG